MDQKEHEMSYDDEKNGGEVMEEIPEKSKYLVKMKIQSAIVKR